MPDIIREIDTCLADVRYVRGHFDHHGMTMEGSGNDQWFSVGENLGKNTFRLIQVLGERYKRLFVKKGRPTHIDAGRRVLRELCNTLTTLGNCLRHLNIHHRPVRWAENISEDVPQFTTITDDGFSLETLSQQITTIEQHMYATSALTKSTLLHQLDRTRNPQCYAMYLARQQQVIAYAILDVVRDKQSQGEERPAVISMGLSPEISGESGLDHAQSLLISILGCEINTTSIHPKKPIDTSSGICLDECLTDRLKHQRRI